MAVEWGRERVQLEGVATIGVDEIAWQKGHKYLTLVYQLDAGRRRLLGVGRERKIETLAGFFDWFGEERSGRLRVVCSDMWKAYLRVVAERAQAAVHVLDRFHIVQKLGKAIDAVRATFPPSALKKQLRAQGEEPVLSSCRAIGRRCRGHQVGGRPGLAVSKNPCTRASPGSGTRAGCC